MAAGERSIRNKFVIHGSADGRQQQGQRFYLEPNTHRRVQRRAPNFVISPVTCTGCFFFLFPFYKGRHASFDATGFNGTPNAFGPPAIPTVDGVDAARSFYPVLERVEMPGTRANVRGIGRIPASPTTLDIRASVSSDREPLSRYIGVR